MSSRRTFLVGLTAGVVLCAVLVLLVAASPTEEVSPGQGPGAGRLPAEQRGSRLRRRCGSSPAAPACRIQRMAQAAACFLVELGNGDKFIFDIGSGSAERLAALDIPYDWLSKVFIGHLHGDHFGDLGGLFVGGGRRRPACPVAKSGDRAARRRSSGPPTRSSTWRRCTPGTSPGGSDRRTSAGSPPRCTSSTTGSRRSSTRRTA